MRRVARGFDTEPIQRGLARIPPRILDRLGRIDFLCGVDPVFVGLNDKVSADDLAKHGYDPETVDFTVHTHVLFPSNQRVARSDRVTTIALPKPLQDIYGHEGACGAVVAHEVGHCIDRLTGYGDWRGSEHGLMPVCALAETNWYEAFAESFEAWLYPELYSEPEAVLHGSPVVALFEELAR